MPSASALGSDIEHPAPISVPQAHYWLSNIRPRNGTPLQQGSPAIPGETFHTQDMPIPRVDIRPRTRRSSTPTT